MKKEDLLQKIKSAVGATILSSFLATNSLGEGTINRINLEQDHWETSFPAQVKTTKMDNYTVIDRKDVPVYFQGKINNSNSAIGINYSTVNLSTLNKNNLLGISSYQTRVYVVVPEGVNVEILEESIIGLDKNNLLGIDLKQKSKTTYAKRMQNVGDWVLGKLREFDPLENTANVIGLNEDEEKFGIYETVKSWLVTKPEARTKEGIEKILNSEQKPQILQVDLYPQDRIVPLEEVHRGINLRITAENYSKEKIPISIFERIQIGDSPSTTGQGIVEAYASFELENPDKKFTNPSLESSLDKLVGKWVIGNNIEVWPELSFISIEKKSDKVYSLEQKQNGQSPISIEINVSGENNFVLKLNHQKIMLSKIPTNINLEDIIPDIIQKMQIVSEHENTKRNLSSTHSIIKDSEATGKPVNPAIKKGNEQGLNRESEEIERGIKELRTEYPFIFNQEYYSGITNGGFWWKQNGLEY